MIYVLFAMTAAICFYGRPVADRLKVFDYPRGGRKHHAHPTPQVGGLAIVLPVMLWIAVQLLAGDSDPFLRAVLLCGGGVSIVGIMDDQSHLSPGLRLLVLANFALISFALDPQLFAPRISWASFAPAALPQWAFVVFGIVAVAGFVSSVNMADGINGLVPSAFLIWCAGFAIFGDGAVREVATALIGPVLVMLAFNLRGRVFLGDCGTFGIGFLVALMAVASLRGGGIKAETLLVWFCIPVLDCLRVIATRLMAGRSPLRGGKDHFHHMLADVFGKERALYAYVFLIVSTSALAALVPLSAIFLLLTMTALCLGFMAARVALERQRHRSIEQEGRSNGAIVRPAANGSILK
jgi:UDP-GlcNAc:undecaprenyl-phosphate GlcNAc-1-phosphate transferase